MDETLIIENLGPIKKLKIEPRPLTIIIGEQASGKSLVAQLLYFFRGLERHLARIYYPELVSNHEWHSSAVRYVLNGLRGVPLALFANGVASLRYKNAKSGLDWELELDGESLAPKVLKNLVDSMSKWVEAWQNDPETLGATGFGAIFIPTERGLITRLLDTRPDVLFDQFQPFPLKEFAVLLTTYAKRRLFPDPTGVSPRLAQDSLRQYEADTFIGQCQRKALGGEAAVTEEPPRVWAWKTDSKVLPILGASSGQMEAWPFFEIARIVKPSKTPVSLYFEEPETHLHPRAQVEIMKVVAYLVNRGHNFVITTHSPFLLQVVDNMLQRFQNLKGQIPEGEERWLDPEKVAAYCLRRDSEESPEDIMDRKETGLLDATELEKVSNELGAEFDELLYGAE